MNVITSFSSAARFLKENKARFFWLWITYQAVKGLLTVSFIWIPLFLVWRRSGEASQDVLAWALFALSILIFVVSHIVLARHGMKTAITSKLGTSFYTMSYLTTSLITFGFIFWAALNAPNIASPVSHPALFIPGATLVIVGFMFVAFGAYIPNPWSIMGADGDFDPARPGIVEVTRHPVLWGLVFWSFGHAAVANRLSLLIVFAVFTLFGLVGIVRLERKRGSMTDVAGSTIPNFLKLPAALQAPFSTQSFLIRLGLALFFTALMLLWVHPSIFGVFPIERIEGAL